MPTEPKPGEVCHLSRQARDSRHPGSGFRDPWGSWRRDSIEAALEDYPNITRQDVEAALEFMELDVNP